MWIIFEIAFELVSGWSSWRIWLCIILAIGLIAVAYHVFPEQNGFWPLTSPIALVIIALGCWWQVRADRA